MKHKTDAIKNVVAILDTMVASGIHYDKAMLATIVSIKLALATGLYPSKEPLFQRSLNYAEMVQAFLERSTNEDVIMELKSGVIKMLGMREKIRPERLATADEYQILFMKTSVLLTSLHKELLEPALKSIMDMGGAETRLIKELVQANPIESVVYTSNLKKILGS